MSCLRRLTGFVLTCCLLLAVAVLAGACTGRPAASSPQAPTPGTAPTAASDSEFSSNGGGEPRSPAYWLLWNSCTPDNRAETARANGGRQAGWVIMDDLLADPGVLLGRLQVDACQQGASLLQAKSLDGVDKSADPVYQLAQRMLAAQLNLAAGAETCPAAEKAVGAGQLLLLALDFDGQGDYSGAVQGSQQGEAAALLIEQLGSYNQGSLCR